MLRPALIFLLLATSVMAADLIYVPLPKRERVFVPPETVGVGEDCPFPTVKDRLFFKCPKCGFGMRTHVLYPHLPHCPDCRGIMSEIFPDPRSKKVNKEKMG